MGSHLTLLKKIINKEQPIKCAILKSIHINDIEESKIARFVSGLRREIQDIVELYEYSSLEKLVHLAIQVESQVLKKTTFKNTHNDGFYKSS